MKYCFVPFILSFLSFSILQDNRALYFPKSVEKVKEIPNKNKVWVFILAGQSNMAGRGLVEPQDTIPNKRILTIDAEGQLIYAKEPLHFYEPAMTGLDCGVSFGRTLIKNIPGDISVLVIPTAVGGSAIQQWLGDSTYRSVKLLSNFKQKVEIAKRYGNIKGLLWHQGESDASKELIPLYQDKLSRLFTVFRQTVQNKKLPIIIGQLGSFSEHKEDWNALNEVVKQYSQNDLDVSIVSTQDLKDKGDHIHFNSEGQRKLGERYAEAYLNVIKKQR